MSESEPIATRPVFQIKVGDRICYTGGDVLPPHNYTPWEKLSGEVLGIIELADNLIQLSTSSGFLRPYGRKVEFELVGSDYGDEIQKQYDVQPAEVYAGRSIE